MPNLFHENEFVFNVLFEAVSEGVVVVDENQTIVITNSAAERMFGYATDELQNAPLKILIPPTVRAAHDAHFNGFYKKSTSRQMGDNQELFGVHKTGKLFPVEVGLNPFKISGKTYVMSIIIDISKRKESEQKIIDLNTELEQKVKNRTQKLNNTVDDLREEIKKRTKAEEKLKKALKKEKELNELKTKFLSLVSHEFKTPLSGIYNAAVLTGKYKTSETQEKRNKHLLTIKDKVRYLNGILNDFLSVERLDSGKVNYKITNFKLSKIVNEVIYNANTLLKKGQYIVYPKNIDGLDITYDEKILELILSNLLNNAVKYSGENTKIGFEISVDKKQFTFKISDQGIGIPLKDQKHIFSRYFRAENALTNQGTGIGLNIVKSHIQKFKGTIDFISVVDKGTTFTVKLPLIKET